jgi:hypothetical protein
VQWDLFFPAVDLQRKRKIIAKRKELLAVKMKGGLSPGNERENFPLCPVFCLYRLIFWWNTVILIKEEKNGNNNS